MKRVKTGINGFDELIHGGIPAGNLVLLSGQAGAGKTIFGLQYLVNGAQKFDERGMYVTLEENEDDICEQAGQLGWNLKDLERKEMLKLVYFSITKHQDVTSIHKTLEEELVKFKPKRLVFDSVSAFAVWAEIMSGLEFLQSLGYSDPGKAGFLPGGDAITRAAIVEIMKRIKEKDVTSLVISELPETSTFLSRDTVSEFVADGVILLRQITIGDKLNRTLEVRKMRKTEIAQGTKSYSITRKGIVLE